MKKLEKLNPVRTYWVEPVTRIVRTPVVHTLTRKVEDTVVVRGYWDTNSNPPRVVVTGFDVIPVNRYETFKYTEYVESVQVVKPGYFAYEQDPLDHRASAQSLASYPAPVGMGFVVPTLDSQVVAGAAWAGSVNLADARQRVLYGFELRDGASMVWITDPKARLRFAVGLPAWTPSTRYQITVLPSLVRFYMDDALVAEAERESSSTALMLAAALYEAQDAVEDPWIEMYAREGSGRIALKLSVYASGQEGRARLHAKLQLRVSGHNLRSRIVLPGLRTRGYSWGSRGHVRIGHRLGVFGYGMQGTSGQGAVRLRAKVWGASYPQGSGFASLKLRVSLKASGGPSTSDMADTLIAVSSFSDALGGGALLMDCPEVLAGMDAELQANGTLREAPKVAGRFSAARLLLESMVHKLPVLAGMQIDQVLDCAVACVSTAQGLMLVGLVLDAQASESLQAQQAWEGERVLDSDWAERWQASSSMQPQALWGAAMHELIASVVAMDDASAALVWCVTATGAASEASTTYAGYPFKSFANIGGNYFGASGQGLFALEGDADHGQEIAALVDMGERDFDSNHLKQLSNAYVSTNAALPLRLTVDAGQGAYAYVARSADPRMRTQRFDLGRGLRGHYFGLQLQNEGGAAFELDGLQFKLTESKRRI